MNLWLKTTYCAPLTNSNNVREKSVRDSCMVRRYADVFSSASDFTRHDSVLDYKYDDPLVVDEMIQEVQGEASCLPLLQFTCHLLWERRNSSGRMLRRKDYEVLGGVGVALARHADGVLSDLNPHNISVVRTILLRLVSGDKTKLYRKK